MAPSGESAFSDRSRIDRSLDRLGSLVSERKVVIDHRELLAEETKSTSTTVPAEEIPESAKKQEPDAAETAEQVRSHLTVFEEA